MGLLRAKVQKWKLCGGKSSQFMTVLAQNDISWEHVPNVYMMNLSSKPEVGFNLTIIIHAKIFGAFPQLCYVVQLSFQQQLLYYLCVSSTGLCCCSPVLLPEWRGEQIQTKPSSSRRLLFEFEMSPNLLIFNLALVCV